MKVTLKSAVILPSTEIAPAGVTLEVSEEVASNWIGRGLAEEVIAPAPPLPPPPQQPKGKR